MYHGQKYAQQDKKSCDIIGKPEFRWSYYRLKRTNGTGTRRSRTGIAVQPRHTNCFTLPLINSSLQEVRQVNVGKQRCSRLNPTAKMCEDVRYARPFLFSFLFFNLFLIQFPHTPDTIVLPCSTRYPPRHAKHHSTALPPRRQVRIPEAWFFSIEPIRSPLSFAPLF